MKENMKRKIAVLLTLLGVTSIVIGTTFAIYENTINTNKNHIIKTGVVNFTLTESTNGLVLDNLQELTDYEGMAQETFYEFTIKNTGNTITDYEISLVDKPNSSYTGTILNEKYIKVGLLKNNSKEIIVNLKDVNRLIDKVTLDVEDTVNYKLRLWLDFGNLEDEAKEALVGQKIFLALKINGIQNVNKVPTGADTLIKLTDNKDNSGLYTITHAKDSTLQIGTNEDITEYRYRGASPKNYVTFNGETWRILGVFPTDDGTGNIENRIKIVRNDSIGTKYWDTSGSNKWSVSSLGRELNSSYINTLNTNHAYDMIDNVKYYLGGYTNNTLTLNNMYSYERKISGSGTYYYSSNPNSWVGKIALMYASDYGYAAGDACTGNLSGYSSSTCTSNNWLYNSNNEWLLAHVANGSGNSFLTYNGGVSIGSVSGNLRAVRPSLYLNSNVMIESGDGTSSNPYKLSFTKNEDTSNANAPVLASNMIPVYYDGTDKVWKKADIKNKTIETRWYNYENHIWANAVTPSNYNGGTKALPNAIDVTFVKPNETAIDAFTFGTKQLSGFWYAKFELSHSTLASSSNSNSLGCTNEACSNANGIIIKPSVKSLRYNNISNFFFASRSMEQPNNSFGFISSEVDTHMSKNNEWGAVAYLAQSIYGRCVGPTTCTEVGINNNSTYITGIGAEAGSSYTGATADSYDTAFGMRASTTGNIYGIYDMSGGAWDYVMGSYSKTIGSSGFASSTFPDDKYFNNYTTSSYQGHALTETNGWYNDNFGIVVSSSPWFSRGSQYSNSSSAGVFSSYPQNGTAYSNISARFALTNE